jgi:tetrahydromethanopterin S-methyltransferase subunit A
MINVKQKDDVKEIIKATHHKYKDFVQDKKGYFLIRVNHKEKRIEVGYANNKHVIKKAIFGKNAIELYHTITKNKLLTRLEHAAYLGKELYKAELCLEYNKKYIQEEPLSFGRRKVRLKERS